MCPGLRTCHETPGDMWHYSVTRVTVQSEASSRVTWPELSNQRTVFRRVASATVPGVMGGMWPQSGPIVPPRPQVARQNILWEHRLERLGWFNGRCFNKIIELYWSTTGRNDQLDSLLAMFKGIVIKMKLSFVPTWAHHVFVDFCRLSTESKSVNFMLWWENSHRFLYLYFSLSSVRDERRKKVVICPLCLVSRLVLFTFCWASYLFWTAL